MVWFLDIYQSMWVNLITNTSWWRSKTPKHLTLASDSINKIIIRRLYFFNSVHFYLVGFVSSFYTNIYFFTNARCWCSSILNADFKSREVGPSNFELWNSTIFPPSFSLDITMNLMKLGLLHIRKTRTRPKLEVKNWIFLKMPFK